MMTAADLATMRGAMLELADRAECIASCSPAGAVGCRRVRRAWFSASRRPSPTANCSPTTFSTASCWPPTQKRPPIACATSGRYVLH